MLYNKKEEEFIMSRQKTHHTKQFKLDAINYRKEHPDLTQVECAKNLGIGVSTLARWEAQFRDNDGDIPVIGSGSYASDEAKEIARLKRELRDAQDALDVLKKAIGILNEQFNPERPNAVRCTDITYIWTQDGFVYLNCVMDLYARKIIAWTLADTMEVSTRQKPVVILIYHLLSIQIVAAGIFQMRGVKPLKRCSKAILIVVILTIMPASNLSIP